MSTAAPSALLSLALACCSLAAAAPAPPPAATILREARQQQQLGRYQEALLLSQQAQSLCEAPKVPCADLVPLLAQRGDLLLKLSRYDEAKEVLDRAERLATPAGRPHPLAQVLDHQAELSYLKANYADAERRYERALAVEEGAADKDQVQIAATLQGLGALHLRRRRFGQAEALFLRSLQIRQALLGADHPEVASSYNSLAMLYHLRGELPRAFELYQRALSIRERTRLPDHPELAAILNNLAQYHDKRGSYAEAEVLHQRALRIREAALGPAHYLTGSSLNNLAHLYSLRGDFVRAEPLYRRAIEIYERTAGPAHSSTGTLINNLADLLRKRGDLPAAEALARRALHIRTAALGPEHPNVADSTHSLALVLAGRGRLAEAVPLFTQAFDLYEGHLRREGLGLSDSSLGAFLQGLRGREEAIYALLDRHSGDAQVRRLALLVTLSRKGRSVEETARTFQLIRKSLESPEDQDRLAQLRALREQLASAELSALAPQDRGRLGQQIEGLEEQLAQRSRLLRDLKAQPAPSDLPGRVAKALPKDAALLEYIAYEPEAGASRGEGQPAPARRYVALVLLPDGSTAAAPLASAAVIDAAVRDLLGTLARHPAGKSQEELRSAQALYRLVMGPLRAHLGGRRRLYLSVEGQLHLVPFAALHDGENYLLARHSFSYLSGGQGLLRGARAPSALGEVVVFADPDFSQIPGDLGPLSGTRREAAAIQQLLPSARLYLGKDASKENLLKVRSPAILHVATHGVFLGDEATGGRGDERGMKVSADSAPAAPPQVTSLRRRPALSPLVRSMLILSAGPAPPGSKEARGALTALEVSGMDLSGTQLIVLSACDTGRGELRIGQGVYGLRRAFLLAGAETVVTSLWRVSDEGTGDLMERYYRHLLGGAGRADAMHEAAREMRKLRPHPYFWAPFVVVGDDRPLLGR